MRSFSSESPGILSRGWLIAVLPIGAFVVGVFAGRMSVTPTVVAIEKKSAPIEEPAPPPRKQAEPPAPASIKLESPEKVFPPTVVETKEVPLPPDAPPIVQKTTDAPAQLQPAVAIQPALISVPTPAPRIPPTPPPAIEQGEPRPINLLTLIDPTLDAVNGTWSIKEGVLSCDEMRHARLQINYQPPEEYDFKIVFRRRTGMDEVYQILPGDGREPFRWLIGGWKNSVLAFDLIGGGYGDNNRTTLRRAEVLDNEKVYTSVVKVRRDGVSGWLNGEQVVDYKTDFSDVDLWKEFKVRDLRVLGIGCQKGNAEFMSIELLEVKGKGRALQRKAKQPPAGAVRPPLAPF